MAMIELIFAIVIIAISVLSIPSMMNVASEASKSAVIDEDIMSRLSGWTLENFQARWDENYLASGSMILHQDEGGLGCVMRDGMLYRENNDSTVPCTNALAPSFIPTYPNINADGNLSKGLERLNGGTETIMIKAASGEEYDVNATYRVSYVSSAVATSGNTQTATWVLGSSANLSPDEELGATVANRTNLKRVVTQFYNQELDVDTTLTFFKSNKGN